MDNRELYGKILELVDEKWLSDTIENLWKTELGQTFTDYHNAAGFTAGMMREAGLENVEQIPFPADGKTCYQDKISPLAWDAACGKLTILKSPVAFQDNVVADYARHPFHLIKGSVSTPAEGLNVRLITWEQLTHGQDVYNTMVILDADMPPRGRIVKYMLDAGVLGWVNTSLARGHLTPDGICWMNASTEGEHWHVQLTDRPFIGFCVSPRTGDALLSAARKGEVTANVKCDGRRYKGSVDVVTGIIPGKEKKEFWLLAHLYEPLPDDNANGVIAGISIAKTLKTFFDSGVLPKPRFTLRLVCGLEMYGHAAYADSRGNNLKNEVIGALNLDGFCCRKREPINCWMSPQGSPFFGNSLFEEMVKNIPADILPDLNMTIKRDGAYFDDMFLADSTTGVPVIWPFTKHTLHHNSCQTMEVVQSAVVKQNVTFHAAFTARVLTMSAAELQTLEKTSFREQESITAEDAGRTEVWWKIAETIVPERVTTGLPYDLAKVPKDERKALPDRCIYGPFSRVLSNMDGSKNLKYLMLEAERESKTEITASRAREYLGAIEFLSEYGYLRNRYTLTIKKKDIVASLKKTGIRPGDLLIVHSGLSHFGHIEGGADTVIDAFLEIIGKNGTLMFPTFTQSFIYFNGNCLPGTQYRPFDIKNTSSVWVGRIPSVFLKRKSIIRSLHPTHSVAGTGPLAEKCLTEHRPSDPPTCRRSPFGKLPENNGKMVWFGADLASTTFFHFLEDELNMPYLTEAVCRVKKEDGSIRTFSIDKHLSGHRDFYRVPAEESKMYMKLLEKGLVIKKTGLGFGEIKVIDAKQMYTLGMEALKEDPRLLLCDDKECRFCSRYPKC